MSIAGGLHKAVEAAVALGMDSFQMFTHSPSQWAVHPADDGWRHREQTDDDVAAFRAALRQAGLAYPTAHDSYLINLASPDDAVYRRSIEAFVGEVKRAERLGLSYLVTHPGAHMGAGDETGLTRVARALDETHARCPNFKVRVLLEATAGQGTCLGHRFEHLGSIIKQVKEKKRLGVCVDTCHIFAAGYELAPREKYDATWREFDRQVGIKRLKLFHLNDSKKALGSRVDRHEHLGRGCLGLEPFRLIVNDPRFASLPMILETPKEDGDDLEMDAKNLAILRGLLEGMVEKRPSAPVQSPPRSSHDASTRK
jgi:deoxyribonuclease-4